MFGEAGGCQLLRQLIEGLTITGLDVCELGCVCFVDVLHGCIPPLLDGAVTE